MADWKNEPPSLVYLAIFNPSLAPKDETALEQICLFHPNTTPQNEKARQVGLAQALVNFTSTFSPNTPCETVHTRKHRVVLLEAEKGYWMVMKVRLGTRTRLRDGKKVTEFLGSDIKDSILKAVLRRCANTFKLFHGGLDYVRQKRSLSALRNLLEEFYISYLQRIDFGSLDLLYALNGINFASLSKTAYTDIASFIHTLSATFPELKTPVFLWHDQLVWNGLQSFEELQTLYSYLTDPATGRVYDGLVNQVKRKGEPIIATRRPSLQPSKSGRTRSIASKLRPNQRFSGYLIGPTDTTSDDVNLHKTFIDDKEHVLIVYQYDDECTLVFPVLHSEPSGGNLRSGSFYTRLAAFLQPNLKVLVPLLTEGWAKARNLSEFADQHFRYLYYNSMNLAFKTSIGMYKSTVLKSDLVQCLNQMHEDFASASGPDAVNEICMKTSSEAWIVGRRSGDRELYLIFPKSDMGLVDVDDEVSKFTMAYFSDILQ
ncbi:uncharacterized protein EV422DRAFT_570739 [Fimicolochytrium jonesii]|uniref:uncharacterized protein n=1 Tax=Fimicolochytrium jonesii TaxID=1396493 RepID=UPI0022FDD1CC|nr:uncharacterized protein EV422DRAFT_570739 [Fimicolochytrium jonesii]KAI8817399.1 hypothetical protein EV422DRAFT_570739 [Fimicolochytrium jonesii]